MKNGTETCKRTNEAGRRGLHGRAATLVMAALLASFAVARAQSVGQNAATGPQPVNGAIAAAPSAPAAAPASPGQAAPQPGGLFPTQPPPAQKPGFIYAFGRWWDNTRGKIDDLSKQRDAPANPADSAAAATQDVLKGAAEATKNAATALVRLPAARFVETHQRCAIAPNGAPDCRTAAANVCRSKGFTDGHPINVQSSQDCPPAVWMSGREPTPGECPQETVVLMAACD